MSDQRPGDRDVADEQSEAREREEKLREREPAERRPEERQAGDPGGLAPLGESDERQ